MTCADDQTPHTPPETHGFRPGPADPTRQVALRLRTPAATDAAATAFAPTLRAGDVVLLSGVLGAGKSAFARAAIRTMLGPAGAGETLPSPTYTLAHTYETPQGVTVHADLYRLTGADELDELGLVDQFDAAIAFIEWPDRLGAATPPRRVHIQLNLPEDGGGGRLLVAAFYGEGWTSGADALEKAVGAVEDPTVE